MDNTFKKSYDLSTILAQKHCQFYDSVPEWLDSDDLSTLEEVEVHRAPLLYHGQLY